VAVLEAQQEDILQKIRRESSLDELRFLSRKLIALNVVLGGSSVFKNVWFNGDVLKGTLA
jgi:hypothetical protein